MQEWHTHEFTHQYTKTHEYHFGQMNKETSVIRSKPFMDSIFHAKIYIEAFKVNSKILILVLSKSKARMHLPDYHKQIQVIGMKRWKALCLLRDTKN